MNEKNKNKIITILIAEDENNIRIGLGKLFTSSGYRCLLAENGEQAYKMFMRESVDVIVSDIKMPGLNGLELLEKINQLQVPIPIIFITGHGSIEMAVETMQKGAYDFMLKPIDVVKLEKMIEKLLKDIHINQEIKQKIRIDGEKKLIGESYSIKSLIEKIKHIAPSKSNVYIYGESGTGKEVVCDMLHYYDNPKTPLIKVNCSALSEGLLESELFGHEKGSFTGAISKKIGRFEAANGGTLFLDEISEISKEIQVKLLRVLQDKTIERVGSSTSIKVDIRLICASNKPLFEEVKRGNFREDLFYRLNVIDINIPPLRERREDIPILSRHFFNYFATLNNKSIEIDATIYEKFKLYNWPGNVRELQNVIEKIVVLSRTSKITMEHIPSEIIHSKKQLDFIEIPYGTSLKEAEKTIILAHLDYCNGNKTQLAKVLEVGRRTIQRKLSEYGLDEQDAH